MRRYVNQDSWTKIVKAFKAAEELIILILWDRWVRKSIDYKIK